MNEDKACLFCEIVAGTEPCEKVWENNEFIAIKNKYPVAKVHLLVMPKKHVSKRLESSKMKLPEFWSKIMQAVFEVVNLSNLDKTGYKLVNNGAGYNHFDHEHIHVLGGTESEPGGKT